ncbi:hypothetical protein UFOVP147_46 [uncultured Caudovirales phage]|uniref:Uncharacterized protein n=1 Tax=uncultured Caudovirales phage TaxID=2100421 RepID=A0A6J7W1J1_9CAUD|nr:hypothetical protein UFOVP147_46 [uncultured Caudovirales phage]
MDTQTAFNIVLSLVAFLGGWVLNSLRDSIKALQKTDAELADKVQHIEVLVAGQYVKRDDLEKLSTALFNKLDKIEMKLDGKADK